MKRRSLLLLAVFAASVVGCGGDGGGSNDARRDVENYFSNLERAYQVGVDDHDSSDFANLVSLNYCQFGRDRSSEIGLFQSDVDAALDAGAVDVRIERERIDNPRYTNNDNIIDADVEYQVVFYDRFGDDVYSLPFYDDELILRYEGSRYRNYGNGQCDLKGVASSSAQVRQAKPSKTTKPWKE